MNTIKKYENLVNDAVSTIEKIVEKKGGKWVLFNEETDVDEDGNFTDFIYDLPTFLKYLKYDYFIQYNVMNVSKTDNGLFVYGYDVSEGDTCEVPLDEIGWEGKIFLAGFAEEQ
jgi:hypothetical protein